jgi:serine/threonine protein kinase
MMLFGETLNGHAHPMRRILILRKDGAVIADPNNEVSDAATDFLLKLFAMDPLKRMTADEAMNHAWIADPNPADVVLKTSWKVWRSRYEYNQGKYPPSPDKN